MRSIIHTRTDRLVQSHLARAMAAPVPAYLTLPVIMPSEVFAHSQREAIMDVYERNIESIYSRFCRGPLLETYVYTLQSKRVPARVRLTEAIYDNQGHVFKVTAALGMILEDVEKGEFKYFYPSWNGQTIWDVPDRITHRASWNFFLDKLEALDLYEHGALSRPNT